MDAESPKPGTSDGLDIPDGMIELSMKEWGRLFRELMPLSRGLLMPRRYRLDEKLADLYPPPIFHVFGDASSHLYVMPKEIPAAGEDDELDKNHFVNLCMQRLWIEAKCPTYYMGPDIGEALLDTDPPADQPVEEVNWPFPCMRVIPPIGWLQLYEENVVAIDIALLGPGEHYPHPVIQKETLNWYPEYKVLEEKLTLENPYLVISIHFTGEKVSSRIAATGRWQGTMGEVMRHFVKGDKPAEFEERIRHLFRLAVNSLMLLSMVPDEVEPERLERPEKRNKRGEVEREALWRPSFIGRPCFKQLGVGAGKGLETGAYRFNEVRKGHWKRQPYGPGRTLRKTKWIHLYRTRSMEERGIKDDQPRSLSDA